MQQLQPRWVLYPALPLDGSISHFNFTVHCGDALYNSVLHVIEGPERENFSRSLAGLAGGGREG